jgi:hypothetical protein
LGLFCVQEFTILTHQPVGADHRGHAWRTFVADAMSETNPEKLRDKIAAAEAAVFDRLQALAANSTSQPAEVGELREASETLLALKTSVLKFPDWRQP